MMKNSDLVLGYDFDKWYGYGAREPIITDLSTQTNSHILLSGMSGGGKSHATNLLLARISKAENEGIVYFADFKQDEQFSYLRSCPRYYPYEKSIEALEIVYDILKKRQSGEDKTRNPVTLIWDEYVANILALQITQKKKAEDVMQKISEILMLGRSLGIRLVISLQRPDASVFPSGSRLNFGIILILGAAIKSIYEMLIPREYIEDIGSRIFKRGEGVALLQGSEMKYIKIPTIRYYEKMKEICIAALTRKSKQEGGGGEAAKPPCGST